jgi:hypothetical protein
VPCTAFPLPFVQRDNDGGLEPRGGLCYEPAGVGTCANGEAQYFGPIATRRVPHSRECQRAQPSDALDMLVGLAA